nr:hypothetical protein Iba_chr05aCG7860 [Ipomoea batatas]
MRLCVTDVDVIPVYVLVGLSLAQTGTDWTVLHLFVSGKWQGSLPVWRGCRHRPDTRLFASGFTISSTYILSLAFSSLLDILTDPLPPGRVNACSHIPGYVVPTYFYLLDPGSLPTLQRVVSQPIRIGLSRQNLPVRTDVAGQIMNVLELGLDQVVQLFQRLPVSLRLSPLNQKALRCPCCQGYLSAPGSLLALDHAVHTRSNWLHLLHACVIYELLAHSSE